MKDIQAWENILRLIKEDFQGNEYAFAKAIKYNYPLFEKNKQRKSLPIQLLRAMFRNKGISSDYILYGLGPAYR